MPIKRISLKALAKRLRPGSRTASPAPPDVQGNLDSYRDGVLTGWAFDPADPASRVRVEVHLGGVAVASGSADRFRADLETAKIGAGHHAFSIELAPGILAQAKVPGQMIEVWAIGRRTRRLGSLSVSEVFQPGPSHEFLDARVQRVQASVLAKIAAGALADETAGETSAAPVARSTAAPAYLRLLTRAGRADAGGPADLGRAPPLSPYADQLMDRLSLKQHFPGDNDRDHFYRWYIDAYGRDRYPHRAPFSAEELAYLNAPIPLGGYKHALSRVALWYALADQAIRASLDLTSDACYGRVAAWWASRKAPSLHVEDCLVADRMETFLRSVSESRQQDFLPLSHFMEEALAQEPDQSWSASIADSQVRIAFYFLTLLEAADNPGILRFIPRSVLEYFLIGPDPQFQRVSEDFAQRCGAPQPVKRDDFLALISGQDFDIERGAFRTLTPEGHRIDAMRLRALPTASRAPFVQVIAPFEKASGLATAGRSTREVLRLANIPQRAVNFTIDNPQPNADDRDYSDVPAGGPAINIVHVNADLIQLVYAYSPDVFTSSYNIGFFFWELSEIPSCHRLALDLVDEIWVSSEYNRACYARATRKPVLNMRLAALEPPAIDRVEARAEMGALAGTADTAFVFLLTYDSFSFTSRKNPMAAIRAFREAFPDDRTVQLVIKTHNASTLNASETSPDWRYILDACEADPRICLIDRTMSHEAVLRLIAGADCYVSLHRSEGFGLGMLEAMQLGTPVVCTGYSGNVDFCTPETAWLVGYDEVSPKAGEYAYVGPDHLWAEPRHASAVEILRSVRQDSEERGRRARNAGALVRDRYRPDVLAGLMGERIRQICSGRQIEI